MSLLAVLLVSILGNALGKSFYSNYDELLIIWLFYCCIVQEVCTYRTSFFLLALPTLLEEEPPVIGIKVVELNIGTPEPEGYVPLLPEDYKGPAITQRVVEPVIEEQPGSYDETLDWRIVGGSTASSGQFPYIASLRRSTGAHFCGSSIISTRYVVSAAHCTVG